MYVNLKSRYPPICLKIFHSFLLTQSLSFPLSQSTQLQTINVDFVLVFGHMAVELASDVENDEIFSNTDHHKTH